jgi:valyl-tRNA synthetase
MTTLPKRYDSSAVEAKWRQNWEDRGIYKFQSGAKGEVYSIDTPPPTVSGDLHMGHCFSYSHPDFYARFWRMRGRDVFYPMGWDDNGLPTERLVEKRLGITPEKAGAETFIQTIIETSRELETKYRDLWQRLGLSVDWDFTYSTISPAARKTAQQSFLDLYQKGLVYRSSAPAIWCPLCKTAIAHAEVSDLPRPAEFFTLAFKLEDGSTLPIATTRPELLPACVAVFVNPVDPRYKHLIGNKARTPLFDQEITILADPKAEIEKGTGAVMCCTFGDATDVKWWREHNLPAINLLGSDGRLNENAGMLAGLDIKSARRKIVEELTARGLVLDRKASSQTASVHERCDTGIEYLAASQWFVKVLDHKDKLLKAGRQIEWHPSYMLSRYADWVEHLEWDWCISRQRYHGVPFPLWYCEDCGETILADSNSLPIDPRTQAPHHSCQCGSREYVPETSVMDTWMTSSMSPQVAGQWLEQPEIFNKVFPMSLRPQAHDIIRTWTFYTIVKSIYHFGKAPWSHVAISGHGLSPEGHKVSKSRANNLIDPLKVMEKYSADAVRYWAAATKLGEDAMIAEDKIAFGQRLVNKLWSVASFAQRFLEGYKMPDSQPPLQPADCWALSRLQRLISEATEAFTGYDHSQAKSQIESYFWDIFTDNYLEMVKTRLYDSPDGSPEKESARYTLYRIQITLLKLLTPLLPYVTEEIYQLYQSGEASIHSSQWPEADNCLVDEESERIGDALLSIATAVRRYKSENRIPLGTPIERIRIIAPSSLLDGLQECRKDISSITRARNIEFTEGTDTVEVNVL